MLTDGGGARLPETGRRLAGLVAGHTASYCGHTAELLRPPSAVRSSWPRSETSPNGTAVTSGSSLDGSCSRWREVSTVIFQILYII